MRQPIRLVLAGLCLAAATLPPGAIAAAEAPSRQRAEVPITASKLSNGALRYGVSLKMDLGYMLGFDKTAGGD